MSKNIFLILLGMAVVTYIPRMIPFSMMKDISIPKRLDKFLYYIPYTMLSALIFPNVFNSTAKTTTATIAVVICFIGSFMKLRPTLVVIIGIITVYITQLTNI